LGLNSRLGRGRAAAMGAGVALALLGPSGVALADDPDPSASTPVGTLAIGSTPDAGPALGLPAAGVDPGATGGEQAGGSGPGLMAPPAPLTRDLPPLGAGLPAVVAPATAQLPGLRLPVCALALQLCGPRGRERGLPDPASSPPAGDAPAQGPAAAGPPEPPAPAPAPALASTGTPIATALAGLVLLLLGGLLTWVRACD
jgi:hypothetical protein